MAIKTLNPYLNFDGTAARAIKLYETTLGAKTEGLMRFGDTKEGNVPPEHKDRVMHAVLHLGGGVVMVSDTQPGMSVTRGDNTWVVLQFDDAADMAARFDALAQGGSVAMPLQDTFWGARFGMLQDAFGIRWMFNCDLKRG